MHTNREGAVPANQIGRGQTRENVFLQGIPDAKGSWVRKKSSLSPPNITKSRPLAAPHTEPHTEPHKSTNMMRTYAKPPWLGIFSQTVHLVRQEKRTTLGRFCVSPNDFRQRVQLVAIYAWILPFVKVLLKFRYDVLGYLGLILKELSF